MLIIRHPAAFALITISFQEPPGCCEKWVLQELRKVQLVSSLLLHSNLTFIYSLHCPQHKSLPPDRRELHPPVELPILNRLPCLALRKPTSETGY